MNYVGCWEPGDKDDYAVMSVFSQQKLFQSHALWASTYSDYRILPNKRACLNKRTPCLLNLTGYISETTEKIWIIFSAHKVQVYGYPHCDVYRNQTRLRVRFLPLHLACLFCKIWYMYYPFARIGIFRVKKALVCCGFGHCLQYAEILWFTVCHCQILILWILQKICGMPHVQPTFSHLFTLFCPSIRNTVALNWELFSWRFSSQFTRLPSDWTQTKQASLLATSLVEPSPLQMSFYIINFEMRNKYEWGDFSHYTCWVKGTQSPDSSCNPPPPFPLSLFACPAPAPHTYYQKYFKCIPLEISGTGIPKQIVFKFCYDAYFNW